MLFGLLTLYSAGQTDVPTHAAGVWYRQFFWFGVGVVAGWVVFHVSLRLLEWLAPALYAFSLVLLGVVLVVGTGAGTAQSSHSWLSIGGHQIGQPSELAKVATVLMLARYLSGRKEPPRSLRDLLVPGLIVGVPFLLVLKQPDLGSAIVFIGIAFAMLFWAGVRPRLLFMIASPGLSLLLAFNNWAWGAWMVGFTDPARRSGGPTSTTRRGLVPQCGDGHHRPAALAAPGAVPAEPPAHLPQSRGRSAGRRLSRHPVAGGDRLGRLVRHRLHPGPPEAAGLPAGAAHRLRVSGRGRGAGLRRRAWWRCRSFWRSSWRCSASPAGPPTASAAWSTFGILGLFFTHVFENVGMTVNLMPITGIPLPFFSYGGSFFIICSLCLGLAFRVAWDSRQSGYPDI